MGKQRLHKSRMVPTHVKKSRKVWKLLAVLLFTYDLFLRSVFNNFLNIQLFVTAAPSADNYDTISLALALELLYKVNNISI